MLPLQITYNIDANKNSTATAYFDDDREDSLYYYGLHLFHKPFFFFFLF